MAGAIILLAFWGIVWSGIAMLAPGAAKLIVALIAWGPLGLLLWWKVRKAGKAERFHAAVLEARGVPSGQGLDHCEDGTGIAVDRKNKMLILIGSGESKGYLYQDVREWSARSQSPGHSGHLGSRQGIGESARMEMVAKKATGLFVTVADVERPLWRVAMRDESTRARWMEILQQEINEGGVRVAGASRAEAAA